ncbi:hypothetical protein GMLC_04930 [Geomonas limicola]|uniref:PilZ domain-containing protein n=1 Tax=Geomonas limicola TaxID=2740186 RepID=A0A6V8N4N0_9BACT|nr:PilZ domain-containing protein [Geomonas limicola]GFO66914.1 hypothetical protein GMLC_04930 [Geomonas limicola]
MDRRQSTRIPFKAPAFVVQNGSAFASEIRDISRHGLFVDMPAPSGAGGSASVSIILKHAGRSLSVTVPCSVARVSGSGIGCSCNELDPETLLFFSNLLHSSGMHPAEFLQAFYSYLDEQQAESN